MRVSARGRDRESGQILVFLCLAAVLLVGFVYLLIRSGERIVFRQEMQGAADAAAFAAAAIKARGMNLIAFINLVMAALVAILVALQLLHDAILVIGASIAAGCCAACLGTCCGFCAGAFYVPAQELAEPFQELRNELVDPIMAAASALMPVQEAIRGVAPAWASVEAWRVARENADGARTLVTPPYEPLPVHRDASFAPLCERAIDMATWPIERVLPGWLGRAVAGLVGDWAESSAGWYCAGDTSGASAPREYDRVVAGAGACESCVDGVAPYDPGLACESPERASSFWIQMKERRVLRYEPPDAASPTIGEIEPAEWPDNDARCDRASIDTYEGEQIEDEPCPPPCDGSPACRRRAHDGSDLPCTDDPCGEGCDGEWQAVDDRTEFALVGVRLRPGPARGSRLAAGMFEPVARVVTEERVVWFRLTGCLIRCRMDADAGNSPALQEDTPKAMSLDVTDDDGGHWAHDARNQVRAFAVHADDVWGRRRAVGVGTWGRGVGRDLAPASVLTLAQAEFFAPSADLWEMDWRARLRRFWLPPGGLADTAPVGAADLPGVDLFDGMDDRLEEVGLGATDEGSADFVVRRFLLH